MDRIPVVLGKNGSSKKYIEEMGNVGLVVDSTTGDVSVMQKENAILAAITGDVIRAIGRGFSPERATTLYGEDMQLAVISLREFAKPGSHRIGEMKGRIIGKSGKTRKVIEDLAGAYISVYGDTVSIIGNHVSLFTATEAIRMLLNGRKHRTVYEYLEKLKREEKYRNIADSFS
ncbi:MAG: KH domain-containing protein [Candidatus Thermoplasmatota archaeon]|nr:KH domain-containing protein [Candidatus Thermoplasmatota archaeon]